MGHSYWKGGGMMSRDLEEAKAALLECFPNSFVNENGEFSGGNKLWE